MADAPSFPQASGLEGELRNAVAQRMQTNPLLQQRGQALEGFLSSPGQIRSDLAQTVQETPLSPTQQSQIESSRRAESVIPLSSINELLNVQTGGLEGIIRQAGQAFDTGGGGGADSFRDRLALFNALKPSATQESQAIQAGSGLRAVEQLESLLGGKGADKILRSQAVPTSFLKRILGGKEAQSYDTAAQEAYDVFLRTRTGAALNLNEQEFYKTFVPNAVDAPSVRSQKLNRLKQVFQEEKELGRSPVELLFGGSGSFGEDSSFIPD